MMGVLLKIVAMPVSDSAIVRLGLAAGLRVVRCSEHILDPQDLIIVLEKSQRNCFPLPVKSIFGGA